MNKIIMSAIFAINMIIGSNAFASDSTSDLEKQVRKIQAQIEEKYYQALSQNPEEVKLFISTNIGYLENTVINKINKASFKLEEYALRLNYCQDASEVQQLQKKMQSKENKIRNLHEILKGIDTLKMKMSVQ